MGMAVVGRQGQAVVLKAVSTGQDQPSRVPDAFERRGASGAACLDEDTVTDLLAGRRSLDDQLEQHLADCAICARLLGAANVTVQIAPAATPEDGRPSAVTATSAGTRTRRLALEAGTVLNETYVVKRLIGRGGMGEVYEVSHTRLTGPYAVKVLRTDVSDDEELLSRFRREAAISSSLRHPHIIQVFDFDRTPDGCIYLAMEYLQGQDLGRLLGTEGPLALERVLRIAGQIASALTAAHRRNVIHRDLKPENVFIVREEGDGDERIKLMDFGLSKWSHTPLDSSMDVSRDQALIGTPRYMAPEQALGRNREIAATTDQFAFAAMVYEMLAGAPAFPGDNLAPVLHHIVYEDPPDLRLLLPGLPEGVATAVARALAKKPSDRFASIQDFHRAMLDAIAPGTLPRRRPRRRWWTWALGASLLAMALAAGIGVAARLDLKRAALPIAVTRATPTESSAAAPPARVTPPATPAAPSDLPPPVPPARRKKPGSRKAAPAADHPATPAGNSGLDIIPDL
jgi:tRNA A-37 threonylcarbamoyl transferase component Bud32